MEVEIQRKKNPPLPGGDDLRIGENMAYLVFLCKVLLLFARSSIEGLDEAGCRRSVGLIGIGA